MFGYDLLHGPDSIGLECLICIPGNWFIRLRGSKICTVKEGIETGVSGHGEIIVPTLCLGGGVSGGGGVDGTDRLRARLGTIVGYARCHLVIHGC